jgi:hypothetical protein
MINSFLPYLSFFLSDLIYPSTSFLKLFLHYIISSFCHVFHDVWFFYLHVCRLLSLLSRISLQPFTLPYADVDQESSWGAKGRRGIWLTTSTTSVGWLSRKCASLDVPQSYESPRSITRVTVFYLPYVSVYFTFISMHFTFFHSSDTDIYEHAFNWIQTLAVPENTGPKLI